MQQIETREKIIEVCKDLIQTKGYHSFSLGEVTKLAETSHGNLYHHFKSKEKLVKETIIKYREDVSDILTEINREQSSLRGCLDGLINVYAEVLEPDNKKICLCMSLMAELNTLPQSIITELNQFFDLQVNWIISIFQQYESDLTLLNYEAAMLISSLEGMIAVARMKGGADYFKNLAYSLIDNFLISHQEKLKSFD